MRFRSYPKVGSKAANAAGPWVATEKLHGANFVVGVEGDRVRFGKRKAWLAADEPFFGWQLVASDLADRARHLAREANEPTLVLYGELLGGGYPHPAVAPTPGLSPVQTGIWYSPDLRWVMFDALVLAGDESDAEWLSFRDLERLAARVGLLVAPVIARGRRDELERLPASGVPALPPLLGLPHIAENVREGYVLKPDRRMRASLRPVVKRKIAELDDARFDEADAFTPGHLTLDELAAWAGRLINDARMASARSKVGTDRGAIIEEIVLDVAYDLATVFADSWRSLREPEETRMLEVLRALAEDRLAPRRGE